MKESIWTRSMFCLMAVALVLSLDYSLTLITFQAFWLAVGGRPELSGLVFGCYDGLTIIIGPVLGVLVELLSFRTLFLIGVAVNASGNVIYCFGDVADSWVLLLVGRLVAGVGASAFPLTMAYVATAFDRSRQMDAVGYVKYAAALARIIGPLLSSAFVSIPVPPHDASTARLLFSGLTVPCWIAAALGVTCFLLLFLAFQNPPRKPPPATAGNGEGFSLMSIPKMIFPFIPIWLAQFVATGGYWSFGSNLLILSAINYRMVSTETELWKLYLAGVAGFVTAFVFFLYSKRRMKPISFVFIGFVCQAVGAILFSPFPKNKSAPFTPPLNQALFHCAVAISTLGYGLLVPAITAVNNLQAKTLRRFSSFFVTLIISFGSAARLAGPAVFSSVVTFQESPGCDLSDGHEYKVDGCHLHNLGTFIAVIEALLLCSMLLALWRLTPKPAVRPGPKEQQRPIATVDQATSNGAIKYEMTRLSACREDLGLLISDAVIPIDLCLVIWRDATLAGASCTMLVGVRGLVVGQSVHL